jgi:hypothetical protein
MNLIMRVKAVFQVSFFYALKLRKEYGERKTLLVNLCEFPAPRTIFFRTLLPHREAARAPVKAVQLSEQIWDAH